MFFEKIRRKLFAFYVAFVQNAMAFLVLLAVASGFACFVALATCNFRADPTEARGRRASAEIRRDGHAKEALTTLLFRGDVTMPPHTRAAIDRAARDMTRVSCGMAKVDVVWNYEGNDDLARALLGGDSVIKEVSVDDVLDTMGRADANDLLGITRAAKNPRWNLVWIFLVEDRLKDDDQLTEWVALHEFCHALGMQHVETGLMEPRAPFFFGLYDQPEWSVDDQNEFCRIYRCDASAMIKCDLK